MTTLRFVLRSTSLTMLWALVIVASTYAAGADVAVASDGSITWGGFRDAAFGGLLAGGLTSAAMWARIGRTWGRLEAKLDELDRRSMENREAVKGAHQRIDGLLGRGQ